MHPLLYEINTRCWLRELSVEQEVPITLANVPEREFDTWQRLGFTHLWLMGVWSLGPRSREFSRRQPDVRRACAELLPDLSDEDIAGSPYAIAGYDVSPTLGGEKGLRTFRQQLAARGLNLVLDFVPNHTGLDHPWLAKLPETFVRSEEDAPGSFLQHTTAGPQWIANGRDPCFPAWADTAQLDYRNPDTRAAMIAELKAIASRCDGVRCDMAMLVLNDIFGRTWPDASLPDAASDPEFWTEAITATKKAHPNFLFLAEAYWDLEPRLQSLGFDYTYDKRLYDHLVTQRAPEAQRHLLGAPPDFIRRCAHFLENHDEPRIASLLTVEAHRAAAVLTLGLPGMRFLHEGQLTGAVQKVSVHLGRRPLAPTDARTTALYESLLIALKTTAVGRGRAELLPPATAWADNPTAQNFVLIQWQSAAPGFDLVVVNLAPERSQCYARLTVEALARHHWEMKDVLGVERHERVGFDLVQSGLYLDIPAHGAQLFHFRPLT